MGCEGESFFEAGKKPEKIVIRRGWLARKESGDSPWESRRKVRNVVTRKAGHGRSQVSHGMLSGKWLAIAPGVPFLKKPPAITGGHDDVFRGDRQAPGASAIEDDRLRIPVLTEEFDMVCSSLGGNPSLIAGPLVNGSVMRADKMSEILNVARGLHPKGETPKNATNGKSAAS